MKPFLLLSVLFSACAQTTFYDRHSGKPVARFQGDMTGSHYKDGPTSWDVDQVSHSAATLAQGAAAANVITATGVAASGVALAAGSSGLFGKAAGVAIPAVSQMFQPRPAALQSH